MEEAIETGSEVRTERDRGFTLVEVVIAIVLVGILSAVVVVGVGNLTSRGNTSACQASLDAARAATSVHYASNSNTWPSTFESMTTGASPALTLPTGGSFNAAAITGPPAVAIGNRYTMGGWTLTMTPSVSGAAPTFVCA